VFAPILPHLPTEVNLSVATPDHKSSALQLLQSWAVLIEDIGFGPWGMVLILAMLVYSVASFLSRSWVLVRISLAR